MFLKITILGEIIFSYLSENKNEIWFRSQYKLIQQGCH